MTRMTAVLIPLFLIAFVAMGCAGDVGGAGKAKNKTVYVEDIDPIATAIERGYMSFAAADNPIDQPSHWRVTSKAGMEPQHSRIFEPTNISWNHVPAGVTAMSFRAPSVPPAKNLTLDIGGYTANRLDDQTIVVKSVASGKTGYLTKTEVNGVSRTVVTSSDGVPSFGSESTFPRIVEDGGRTMVVMATGECVFVE